MAENARGNALFGLDRKPTVYEDWVVETVGLKLGTHHPVVEPVSASRRERKFPMQRQAVKTHPFAYKRPILETGQHAKCPVPAH